MNWWKVEKKNWIVARRRSGYSGHLTVRKRGGALSPAHWGVPPASHTGLFLSMKLNMGVAWNILFVWRDINLNCPPDFKFDFLFPLFFLVGGHQLTSTFQPHRGLNWDSSFLMWRKIWKQCILLEGQGSRLSNLHHLASLLFCEAFRVKSRSVICLWVSGEEHLSVNIQSSQRSVFCGRCVLCAFPPAVITSWGFPTQPLGNGSAFNYSKHSAGWLIICGVSNRRVKAGFHHRQDLFIALRVHLRKHWNHSVCAAHSGLLNN